CQLIVHSNGGWMHGIGARIIHPAQIALHTFIYPGESEMGAQENVTTAKAAYAAFTEGDAQAALTLWADDAEFVVRGDSAISGTKRGHDEILTFFGQLGDKNT